MAASLTSDEIFMPHQSLWLDEAAQMAGLGRNPIETTRWLAGTSQHDFGVASDRMPPASYWAQWCWSRACGLTEPSLRHFGIACVSLATLVVFSTGRLRLGYACRLRGGAPAGNLAQRGLPRARDPPIHCSFLKQR